MFNSLQARMMRTAISPRLATRIFSNMVQVEARPSGGPDAEKGLAKFDWFGVFDEDMGHDAFNLGLDLVHHFHGFDQADDRFGSHFGPDFHVISRIRGRGAVKSADHG